MIGLNLKAKRLVWFNNFVYNVMGLKLPHTIIQILKIFKQNHGYPKFISLTYIVNDFLKHFQIVKNFK